MDKLPMTAEGFARLEDELRTLKVKERPEVIQAIAEARAHGDLSENAEYHAAKDKQGYIEARINDLEAKISTAQVINPQDFIGSTTIKFSATVTLRDEDTEKEHVYQIVGTDEAEILKGKLAVSSPIARALIGKSEGDYVEVITPGGDKAYVILKVSYL